MSVLKSIPEKPRTAFGLLTGYFLLHLVLRSLISDSLQTDEAEQCFVTQVWLWGYGSQPPLYAWLQILTLGVFGVKVFALAIPKNLLFFSTSLFTCLMGREIEPGVACRGRNAKGAFPGSGFGNAVEILLAANEQLPVHQRN
jgi:hypothetical protein